jgi:hypothetical protein
VALARAMADATPRILSGEITLEPYDAGEFFLVRALPDGGWEDATCHTKELPKTIHRLRVEFSTGPLKKLERNGRRTEIDLVLLPTPVAATKRGEPPYFPFMLVLLDEETGMPFGMEMISTEEGLDAAYARLPETLIGILVKSGSVPKTLVARHPALLSMLSVLAPPAEIEFEARPDLPAADDFVEVLLQFSRSRR